jgi:WD40 repeat protein
VPESADAFDVGRLKWSPNGESVSLSSEDSVWLKSSRKGGRARKITFDKAVMDYAWSTDSTRLIVAIGDGLGQQTVDGPRGWWITLKRADGNPTALAYRSDKHAIAEGTSKGAIRLRAPDSGEVVATLQGHKKEISGLACL